ncbi:hypothetical protein BY996DRAFT_8686626 [Phakopsora pachyrhizi]|nr:hypothetical protein BY996DRAFT_8686626 [Phakopsora pachyrhizi]
MLHQFFISPEVESYTKGTDSGSVVIGKSLFAMTMIFEWAAPKGTSYSNKEIKDKFQDVNVQQRFALLCVWATYQHFHNHEAPWPEVDEQLEKLKKHTSRDLDMLFTI